MFNVYCYYLFIYLFIHLLLLNKQPGSQRDYQIYQTHIHHQQNIKMRP